MLRDATVNLGAPPQAQQPGGIPEDAR